MHAAASTSHYRTLLRAPGNKRKQLAVVKLTVVDTECHRHNALWSAGQWSESRGNRSLLFPLLKAIPQEANLALQPWSTLAATTGNCMTLWHVSERLQNGLPGPDHWNPSVQTFWSDRGLRIQILRLCSRLTSDTLTAHARRTHCTGFGTRLD